MKYIFSIAALFLIFSCNNNETEVAENTTTDSLKVDSSSVKIDEEKEFKLHLLIANIPSPSHEIIAIKKAGYTYKPSLLIDKSKAGTYNDDFKKGVNYGMFSADLAYAASFPNNKDIIPYFLATRKSAESANSLKIFDDITKSANFESLQGNSDSMEAVLERAYLETEHFFETDHHMDIASRILLGAWVEGQYLLLNTLHIQKSTKADELKNKVWESKLQLMNLNELLKEYESDAAIAPFASSLKEYYKNYDGATGATSFNDDLLKKMMDELTSIRNKMLS
jgi:hypothetical protein